mgnify:CR=1 FL=1
MATQRERNMQKEGNSSYVGKDPFDGMLKKNLTELGIETGIQRNFLSRINSILQRYPNILVGTNPRYIARALIHDSRLPIAQAVDSEQLMRTFDDNLDPNDKFTVIRYVLWLRSLDDMPISESIFPIEWHENIIETRNAYHYVQPSIFVEESDEE